MKKLALIVVSLLVTLFSYAQDFNKVIRASKVEWNGTEWKTVSTNYPTDFFVIMKDWDITIGTSKFKTYDDYEKSTYDDHVTFTWKCVNGNGEKCMFMMKKFRPEVSSHMLYSILYPETGVMYEYETE
jgi:hypothetical protein